MSPMRDGPACSSNGCEIMPNAIKFVLSFSYSNLLSSCSRPSCGRCRRGAHTSRTSNAPSFVLQAWNIPFCRLFLILAQLGTCAQCANTLRRTKTANDSRERFCEKNSVAHLHANASCQVASSGKVGMRSKRCASNLLPNQRILAPPLTFTRRAWQLLWQVDSRDAPHRPLMHDMHMYMVRMRAASCRWRFELMAAACLSPYIFNQPSSSPSRSASCATCVLTHCSII